MAVLKYKDPTTGDWIELSNAVGDTLPIGAIVEYDGTTVPTNWEQVNDYSTEEVNTGSTWINGKPIYRRVVVIPNVTATQTTYNLSSIPIEICMVNTSNSFFAQGNYILPIVSYGANTDWSRAFFEVSTKTLYVQFGSVYTMSKNIYVTIEYTKTTD